MDNCGICTTNQAVLDQCKTFCVDGQSCLTQACSNGIGYNVSYSLCEKGYYCTVGNLPKKCPMYHYCPAGTAVPRNCMFSIFSCLNEKNAIPNTKYMMILVFFIGCGVLLICLQLPYIFKKMDEFLDMAEVYLLGPVGEVYLKDHNSREQHAVFRAMRMAVRLIYSPQTTSSLPTSTTYPTDPTHDNGGDTNDHSLNHPSVASHHQRISKRPITTAWDILAQRAMSKRQILQRVESEMEQQVDSPRSPETTLSRPGLFRGQSSFHTPKSIHAIRRRSSVNSVYSLIAIIRNTSTHSPHELCLDDDDHHHDSDVTRSRQLTLTTTTPIPESPVSVSYICHSDILPTVVEEEESRLNTAREQSSPLVIKPITANNNNTTTTAASTTTTTAATSTTVKKSTVVVPEEFHYHRIEYPLDIKFDQLSMTLKNTSKQVILQSVSGEMKSMHITAIMGPSGSGKTSLLTLLRGQAFFATTSGKMYVNKEVVSDLGCLRDNVAYVPQDDIMYDDLTVEENLLFTSVLFNKRGYMLLPEVQPMVDHTMQLLGISHIRNSVVGSPEKKGISGGQKKRVSIGMEMVKEASLLLLDEPTSGLDSASSISLMNTLSDFAELGVTVVTTIHQPRQEILDVIDDILILAPGGRVVYYGPTSQLEHHFKYQLGYHIKTNCTITDFVMDILAGFAKKDDTSVYKEAPEITKEICDIWDQLQGYNTTHTQNAPLTITNTTADATTTTAGVVNDAITNSQDISATTTNDIEKQNPRNSTLTTASTTPSPIYPDEGHILDDVIIYITHYFNYWLLPAFYNFFKIIYITCIRQLTLFYRTIRIFSVDLVSLYTVGAIMAFLFPKYIITNINSANLTGQITCMQLGFALLTSSAGLRLFSNDSLMRTRETSAGMPIIPYYLGKYLANFTEIFAYPAIFLLTYQAFALPASSFFESYIMLFVLQIVIYGQANLISAIFPAKNRSVVLGGTVVILWAFGGLTTTRKDLNKNMGVFGLLLNYISPFRYTYAWNIYLEYRRYPPVFFDGLKKAINTFGYGHFDTYKHFHKKVNIFIWDQIISLIYYAIIMNILTIIYFMIAKDDFKIYRLTKLYIEEKLDILIQYIQATNAYKEIMVFLERSKIYLQKSMYDMTVNCYMQCRQVCGCHEKEDKTISLNSVKSPTAGTSRPPPTTTTTTSTTGGSKNKYATATAHATTSTKILTITPPVMLASTGTSPTTTTTTSTTISKSPNDCHIVTINPQAAYYPATASSSSSSSSNQMPIDTVNSTDRTTTTTTSSSDSYDSNPSQPTTTNTNSILKSTTLHTILESRTQSTATIDNTTTTTISQSLKKDKEEEEDEEDDIEGVYHEANSLITPPPSSISLSSSDDTHHSPRLSLDLSKVK